MQHPYLSLRTVSRFETEAKRLGVSTVARSRRGFLTAYKQAVGDPYKLTAYWRNRREGFVLRHMAQVRKTSEPLFKNGKPTRRHLALIMQAYNPSRGIDKIGPLKDPDKPEQRRKLMSRTGVPMYAPAQECRCFVTIEFPDGRVKIERWKSRSGFKAIRDTVKKEYPGARLSFGKAFWVTR